MQQSIKTRETQHKQNLCHTVTSSITKKHFNTFVITQLEFGQAPSIEHHHHHFIHSMTNSKLMK